MEGSPGVGSGEGILPGSDGSVGSGVGSGVGCGCGLGFTEDSSSGLGYGLGNTPSLIAVSVSGFTGLSGVGSPDCAPLGSTSGCVLPSGVLSSGNCNGNHVIYFGISSLPIRIYRSNGVFKPIWVYFA